MMVSIISWQGHGHGRLNLLDQDVSKYTDGGYNAPVERHVSVRQGLWRSV